MDKRHRFTSYYEPAPDGRLLLIDPPDGQWSTPPALELGNSGLASTIDDWYAFARMLLGGGALNGLRVLSAASVASMMTNQLTPSQRTAGSLFLDGQGWGYGGSVDLEPTHPWNATGRYGWVGGTGTSAHLVPGTDTVAILLTQVGVTTPGTPTLARRLLALRHDRVTERSPDVHRHSTCLIVGRRRTHQDRPPLPGRTGNGPVLR